MLKVDATMMEEALSCCQHMEGGCPSMAGDCDNDMECQPGTWIISLKRIKMNYQLNAERGFYADIMLEL